LKYIGGVYHGIAKPTIFLCLTLKLLQIQPDDDVIEWFLQQDDFKYLRALAAFYIRLTDKAINIYNKLEPYYSDYRKLSMRCTTPSASASASALSSGSGNSGWSSICIDEFVDALLNDEHCCDITMPYLPKRIKLERQGLLKERVSALDNIDNHDSDSAGKKSTNPKKRMRSSSLSATDSDNNNSDRNLADSSSAKTKKRTQQPDENEDDDDDGDSDVNLHPEGSTAYWNFIRAKAGMKPLKE
jgi:pre-mRNA-splicing factor 38A